MTTQHLVKHLDSDLKEITSCITELEQKEDEGTITTSKTNLNEQVLDELNELYILKDTYDIDLYKGIIDKISNHQLSSVNELQAYLRVEISKADRMINETDNKQIAKIDAKKLSQQQFTKISTLDRILFVVENLIKE